MSTFSICAFCGRSGSGVQFQIFTPRFEPFGTACVECEASLPEGTPHPSEDLDDGETRSPDAPPVPCADGYHEHADEDEQSACTACRRDFHENQSADMERDDR